MILHIIIHSHDQLTLCLGHCRHDRIVLSEIFGKVDSLYIWVFIGKCFDSLPGSIPGIIVYKHKFAFVFIKFLKFLYGKLYNLTNGMFGIVTWYNN